jgi:hypothetical protein
MADEFPNISIDASLQEAMRLALESSGPPLVLAVDILAGACVAAAVRHPEWARALTARVPESVNALADLIVERNPAYRFAPQDRG